MILCSRQFTRCPLQFSIERGNWIAQIRNRLERGSIGDRLAGETGGRCKADGLACFSSPLEKARGHETIRDERLRHGGKSSIAAETEDSRRKHGQEEQQVEAGYHRSTHQRHVLWVSKHQLLLPFTISFYFFFFASKRETRPLLIVRSGHWGNVASLARLLVSSAPPRVESTAVGVLTSSLLVCLTRNPTHLSPLARR